MSDVTAPKSGRGRAWAFRVAAIAFTLASLVFVAVFIRVLVSDDEIRSGVATYALITAAAAFGLWQRRAWGRSVALLISLATAGLGAVTLLAILFSRQGSAVLPAIVLVGSVVMAYWLSRPSFSTPVVDD